MTMRSGSIAVVFLGLVVASDALAQHVRHMDEAQMLRILVRAEDALERGRAAEAKRAISPVLEYILYGESEIDDSRLVAINSRAGTVYATADVRLARRDPRTGVALDPTSLRASEERLRQLRNDDRPRAAARHGEALIAIGGHADEAYDLLLGLHARGMLLEAEGYAALLYAARARGDTFVEASARVFCTRIAGARAARVCPRP